MDEVYAAVWSIDTSNSAILIRCTVRAVATIDTFIGLTQLDLAAYMSTTVSRTKRMSIRNKNVT